jgi:acyl-CoA reductase-like NAD-dependent aldehyde dehydrogenase
VLDALADVPTKEKRRDLMVRLGQVIEEHADELGYLETVLVGKQWAWSANLEPKTANEFFKCM